MPEYLLKIQEVRFLPNLYLPLITLMIGFVIYTEVFWLRSVLYVATIFTVAFKKVAMCFSETLL
jgi:hypothetical protein